MTNDLVLSSVDERVAHIVLNDPGSRNSLSDELTASLIEALLDADAREDVSVIVLSAAGKAFCAGGNIREFLTFRDRSAVTLLQEARTGTGRLFHVLEDLRTPLISVVQGAAVGGGCGIACASSYVFASVSSKFGTTEINLGLFPLAILPAVRRAVGDRNAFELGMTGVAIDATRAQEIGIVDRIVDEEKLLDEALAFARSIAARSPLAVGLGYTVFRETAAMPTHESIDYLSSVRVAFYQSEDLREGAASFLEKRAPKWTGR